MGFLTNIVKQFVSDNKALELLVREHIPKKDAKNFLDWAFGEYWKEFSDLSQFADHWNELHSDEFSVNYENNVQQDVLKMIEIWKQSGNGE
jgi:hypothetical protein